MPKEFRENIDLASVFIANNLAIFGFEDSAAALLQVLKELFDNSIDAIKRNGNSPNCSMDSVRIIVSNEEAEGILKIEINDTGVGIQEKESFLNYFKTDKVSTNSHTLNQGEICEKDNFAGRFGVGLSSCLLYSVSVSCHYS